MEELEDLITGITNVVLDDEVQNGDEYILSELRIYKEYILDLLYKEIKERL